jgi:branched-chain amino acid aminotransferase
VEQADLIWMNGEFVAWEDAKVHVLTHGLHYGTGVFEGIRAYEGERGTAVFRHREHLDRLHASGRLYHMEIPKELIARNGLRECYIRPIAFRGYGQMGLYASTAPVEVSIAVWPWGAYLGDESKEQGIRAKVSSWRRIGHQALIPMAKASGQYLNSVLAKAEAKNSGYDEAILLDERNFIAEGSGENIFLVQDGRLLTPGTHACALDGITARSVIEIARDLGYEVLHRELSRADLYLADEVFFTGTAAELVPVREIDERPVGDGKPGEITRVLQQHFEDALYGRNERYLEWLDVVEVPVRTEAEAT